MWRDQSQDGLDKSESFRFLRFEIPGGGSFLQNFIERYAGAEY